MPASVPKKDIAIDRLNAPFRRLFHNEWIAQSENKVVSDSLVACQGYMDHQNFSIPIQSPCHLGHFVFLLHLLDMLSYSFQPFSGSWGGGQIVKTTCSGPVLEQNIVFTFHF